MLPWRRNLHSRLAKVEELAEQGVSLEMPQQEFMYGIWVSEVCLSMTCQIMSLISIQAHHMFVQLVVCSSIVHTWLALPHQDQEVQMPTVVFFGVVDLCSDTRAANLLSYSCAPIVF